MHTVDLVHFLVYSYTEYLQLYWGALSIHTSFLPGSLQELWGPSKGKQTDRRVQPSLHAMQRVCLCVMPHLVPSTFLAGLSSSNTHKPTTQNMKQTTKWYIIEKSATTTTLPCYLLSISGILNCQKSKQATKSSQGHHKDQEKIQAKISAIQRGLVQAEGISPQHNGPMPIHKDGARATHTGVQMQ